MTAEVCECGHHTADHDLHTGSCEWCPFHDPEPPPELVPLLWEYEDGRPDCGGPDRCVNDLCRGQSVGICGRLSAEAEGDADWIVDDEPAGAEGRPWERETVECVVCPACAFTFDAEHTDPDGGHTCPNCAPIPSVGLPLSPAMQHFVDEYATKHPR